MSDSTALRYDIKDLFTDTIYGLPASLLQRLDMAAMVNGCSRTHMLTIAIGQWLDANGWGDEG